jgi:hypothetical protein
VHHRDESRHLVEVHHVAEGHDLGPAEVALEQLPGSGAIGVGRLADQHGREVEMRPAGADDLHPRLFPVDELPAPRAAQDVRLRAEVFRLHL